MYAVIQDDMWYTPHENKNNIIHIVLVTLKISITKIPHDPQRILNPAIHNNIKHTPHDLLK